MVQQASVHSIEGGTEKLRALTVHVQWQRASIGSRTPTGPERGMVAMSVVQLSGSFRVCCLAVSVNDCWPHLHGHRTRPGFSMQTVLSVEQAYVHTSEGGTEKLLVLTVPVQWQRASIGSRTPTGPERGMVARSVAPLISRCRWGKS